MKDHFEHIEDYLKGKLDEPTKTEFKQAMTESSVLKEQVELYPVAERVLDIAAAQELKNRIGNIRQQKTKVVPIQKKSPKVFRFVLMAASVLLLLTMGTSWFMSNQYSNEGIASNNFLPYDAGVLLGENDDNFYTQGVLAYQKKDFAAAITAFEKVPAENGLYAETQFYVGNAYLSQNEAEKAIAAFGIVQNARLPQFQEPTEWYLALSYLKAGNEEKAKELLTAILDDAEHFYYDGAVDVLGDLGSVWH
jgi:tetratricopeptide (TPR) repeat protein